jgi:hypothetical protein
MIMKKTLLQILPQQTPLPKIFLWDDNNGSLPLNGKRSVKGENDFFNFRIQMLTDIKPRN